MKIRNGSSILIYSAGQGITLFHARFFFFFFFCVCFFIYLFIFFFIIIYLFIYFYFIYFFVGERSDSMVIKGCLRMARSGGVV